MLHWCNKEKQSVSHLEARTTYMLPFWLKATLIHFQFCVASFTLQLSSLVPPSLLCETDTVGLQEPSPRPPTTCRIYPRGGLNPVNFSSVNHGLAVPGLVGVILVHLTLVGFILVLASTP